MLSGQRGPRAQRHFNGCHDERVKSEHGDPVSSTDKEEKKKGGQSRRQGRGDRARKLGERVKATEERTDGIFGQVCLQSGDGEKQEVESTRKEGNWLLVCTEPSTAHLCHFWMSERHLRLNCPPGNYYNE